MTGRKSGKRARVGAGSPRWFCAALICMPASQTPSGPVSGTAGGVTSLPLLRFQDVSQLSGLGNAYTQGNTHTGGAAWVDYNGHLNDGYYMVVFGQSTDGLMDLIGLDAAGRGATGHSIFTLESHTN